MRSGRCSLPSHHRAVLVAALAAALLAAGAAAGHAAIRYVGHAGADVGNCTSSTAPCDTIQYAIGQSASGDTIRVEEGGLYIETLEISTPIGELTIEGGWTDGFGWQHLDPTATVIDGDDDDHVVMVRPASGTTHVIIENLTIQNGTASATYGGGVAVHTGNAGVTAKVTLQGVVLRDNIATIGGGAAARAWVSSTAQIDILDSLVIDNVAAQGGGFAAVSDLGGTAELRFDASTAHGNGTQDWPGWPTWKDGGGGFYANAIREGTAEIDIVNSMLFNNSADQGGGGFAESGDCGGCAEVANTNIDLLNSTITANGTKALYIRSWDHGVTDVDLTNVIAWGNGFYDLDVAGDVETAEVTAWSSDVGNVSTGFNVSYTTLGDTFDVDPEFVDPADSDYHLTADSPLVDAGVCGLFISGPGGVPIYVRIAPYVDFDEESRPPPVNLAGCDVGADEYHPFERWVSPTGSDSANACTDSASPCETIQHAVDEAIGGGGRYKTMFNLAQGSYNGPVDITDSPAPVTILGGWSSDFSTRSLSGFTTTIDGDGSGSALDFSVSNGEANLTLRDVRLTDGVATTGGGLSFVCQLSHGTLTLDRVVIEDNHATDSGGGLYVRPIACALDVRLTDTMIGDNDALIGGGGGAYFRTDAGSSLDATVYSSTVAGNDASYGGGLVFSQTSTGNGWLGINGSLVVLNEGVADAPDDLWFEENGTGFVLVGAKNSSIPVVTQWGGSWQTDSTLLDVNPGFADPFNNDFHLTPHSPVQDLGLCAPGSTFDCDGDERPPTDCDMGADEFVGPWVPPEDLLITREHLTNPSTREACRSITVGPEVEIGPGTVELRAGEFLVFGNDVEVAAGAVFQARIYLNPACP